MDETCVKKSKQEGSGSHLLGKDVKVELGISKSTKTSNGDGRGAADDKARDADTKQKGAGHKIKVADGKQNVIDDSKRKINNNKTNAKHNKPNSVDNKVNQGYKADVGTSDQSTGSTISGKHSSSKSSEKKNIFGSKKRAEGGLTSKGNVKIQKISFKKESETNINNTNKNDIVLVNKEKQAVDCDITKEPTKGDIVTEGDINVKCQGWTDGDKRKGNAHNDSTTCKDSSLPERKDKKCLEHLQVRADMELIIDWCHLGLCHGYILQL